MYVCMYLYVRLAVVCVYVCVYMGYMQIFFVVSLLLQLEMAKKIIYPIQ